ncbi:AraC family transcriptional regulator [Salinicola avicenniae]|uniref:AraC family transcriptional regulator n=1 Tax=Salinicola avicenniae TaxID=2916836 RepID=UPI0020746526|nr:MULTISPECIES: AraC family transcriptional regulator [unclassified Salinicola]
MHHVIRAQSGADAHIIEVLSDRHFPRHSHDEYGVGVMLDGGHVSWSGRGQVEAGPRHVITVNPNELHDGIPVDGRPRRWRMLFVSPRLLASATSADLASREFHHPAMRDPAMARRLLQCMADIPDSDPGDILTIVGDLFGTLLDKPLSTPKANAPSLGVQHMLERIHDDPLKAPSLSMLASIAGLPAYTAFRRFRREMGITPHAYLKQYRVRLACAAIGRGAALTEAAAISGFADQSHMTRAFVRQLGITPGQWRG